MIKASKQERMTTEPINVHNTGQSILNDTGSRHVLEPLDTTVSFIYSLGTQ